MKTSVELKNIAPALAKFQAEVEGALKSSENPFHKSKYADLAAIWEVSRPVLGKHGLCVVQTFLETMPTITENKKVTTTQTDENGKPVLITERIQTQSLTFTVSIETTIFHESGEWIGGGVLTIPITKNEPQMVGAAATYGRRYTLAAILGIHQEDDDGNSTMAKPEPKTEPKSKPKTEPKTSAKSNLNAASEWSTPKIDWMDRASIAYSTVIDSIKDNPKLVKLALDTAKSMLHTEGNSIAELLDACENEANMATLVYALERKVEGIKK